MKRLLLMIFGCMLFALSGAHAGKGGADLTVSTVSTETNVKNVGDPVSEELTPEADLVSTESQPGTKTNDLDKIMEIVPEPYPCCIL